MKESTPGRIRTPNLLIRSQVLYPVELRALRVEETSKAPGGCQESRKSSYHRGESKTLHLLLPLRGEARAGLMGVMTNLEKEPSVTQEGSEASSSDGRAAQPYEVIARRYRPRTFEEVVGQEAIAETLSQAIRQERLGHAYLFCGPRGVGKTSMARIFARALQCPQAVEGVPCDQCGICDRIFRGEDIDVVEMDGASHRGIDDIRELIQHVRYAPTDGPYRIFIIDEVHMLTREAFNSLLKTLEEPPSHVKFFFATTEPEKVIPTVLSRCQRFDFSPISPADIVRRLDQICQAEGAQPESGLLESIASLARGGMRDSQSLLDQLLSFSGASPTLADLDRVTGRLAPEAVEELLTSIDRGERAEVVRRLAEVGRGGTDPAVLLEQVIEALRDRLHAGVAADWQEADIDRNLLAQEILQEARARIRRLGRAEIVLELALLRLSTLQDLVPLSQWQELLSGPAPVTDGASKSSLAGRGAPVAPPVERGQRTVEEPRSPVTATKPPKAIGEQPSSAVIKSERVSGNEPDDGEKTESTSRVAALRAAVDTSDHRSSPRTVRESAPATSGTPSKIDLDDPRAAVKIALERASGPVLRVVGEQFRVERNREKLSVEISENALEMLGDRRDVLRRELARAFELPVSIEAGVFSSTEEHTELEVGSGGDTEVPEIVEKAREIFRGELFGRGGSSRSMK